MDIPNQFFEVGILLTNDGFVAILKELAFTVVPPVKGNGISGEQPSHQCRDWMFPCPKKKMGMVREECPGITSCPGLGEEFTEPF